MIKAIGGIINSILYLPFLLIEVVILFEKGMC